MEPYSSSWGSYPSIFALGHRAIRDLLQGEVNVEEKIDGSQFSFGLVPANLDDAGHSVDIVYYTDVITNIEYALKIRSKGCVMHIDAPEKMFSLGAYTVKRLAPILHPGWTYRGEFLAKPKHNALAYDRAPNDNVILFDINTGDQEFLSYDDKKIEAERLGLECVPLLFRGRIRDAAEVRQFLDTTSILGGQRIEGVVLKPVDYNLFGIDKKVLMGKFVSEAYKEVHRKSWGENNPTHKDIVALITAVYTSPARWNKAIQHLSEAGLLVNDVKDIGIIMKEIPNDVLKECEAEIKEDLFKFAWPHIKRGLTAGFPQWYKERLLALSFESDSSGVTVSEPTQELGSTQERVNVEPITPSRVSNVIPFRVKETEEGRPEG